MLCVTRTSANNILVGGHQSHVIELDTNRMSVINKVWASDRLSCFLLLQLCGVCFTA